MKNAILYAALFVSWVFGTISAHADEATEARNKQIAQQFYEDLWFNNRTDKYSDYLASEYIVHDIGDRKGVAEPAIEQKITADRFWNNGDMAGEIDYQMAEGDLVATRWTWRYAPNTPLGHLMFGKTSIPIINVFRFNSDGKIVEIWNHRHDIDTGITKIFFVQGLLVGLLAALVIAIYAFRLRLKLRKKP